MQLDRILKTLPTPIFDPKCLGLAVQIGFLITYEKVGENTPRAPPLAGGEELKQWKFITTHVYRIHWNPAIEDI